MSLTPTTDSPNDNDLRNELRVLDRNTHDHLVAIA